LNKGGTMRGVKFKVVYVSNDGRRHSAFAGGEYDLIYRKDTTVRAREDTLGVAVFKTRKQAVAFRGKSPYEVIRVRPIGRGKTVKLICSDQSGAGLKDFYSEMLWRSTLTTLMPPLGTVFYPAIEVLE